MSQKDSVRWQRHCDWTMTVAAAPAWGSGRVVVRPLPHRFLEGTGNEMHVPLVDSAGLAVGDELLPRADAPAAGAQHGVEATGSSISAETYLLLACDMKARR